MFSWAGLREVCPDQSVPEPTGPCFVIKTGGTPSTLQEVQLPDCAGGFSYSSGGSDDVGQRLVSWRSSGDTLQLAETSLDAKLNNARVTYRFQDTPILPDGITVCETRHSVVVLVTTVSSVHKMVFPHPRKLAKACSNASIFSEASPSHARDWCHVLASQGTAPLPHLAASFYHEGRNEALFALANAAGHINVVRMEKFKELITVNQLKSGSYLGRLWGNLGLSKGLEAAEAVLSLAIQLVHNDVFVFGLCRDHKLRMWSASTFDCVMVEDVLAFNAEGARNLQPGSQSHELRKIYSPNNQYLGLALFLCFDQHSQFCIVKPQKVDGQFQLEGIATVYAPDFDMIDFQVTPSHILAMWTDPNGEPVLRYAPYAHPSHGNSSGGELGWSSILLDETLDPEFNPGTQSVVSDPRQVYLQQLFHPGRFSLHTLAKAICIYRRSLSFQSYLNDPELSLSKLRSDCTNVVEKEIQSMATDSEITDEQYLELATQAWARLYSCAIQYHLTEVKPQGLLLDPRRGLICIIKKKCLSFVRPVCPIEHLAMSEESYLPGVPMELFSKTPGLCEDSALAQNVLNLMRAVLYVNSLQTCEQIEKFSHMLSRLHSPDYAGRHIVRQLLTDSNLSADLSQELSTRLHQIHDLGQALEALLRMLELDRGVVAHQADLAAGNCENDMHMEDDDDDRVDYTKIVFASDMGVSIVAESLHQMAQTKFGLMRDLVLVQLLVMECGLSNDNSSEQIRSTLLPRSVVMTNCYHSLMWLTVTAASEPPPNALEQSLRQMAVLNVSERRRFGAQEIVNLARMSARPLSLSEFFLRSVGLNRARSLLTSDVYSQSTWNNILRPLVDIAAQLLWPRCVVPTFQEFLLSGCQHMQIQEYVRLLSSWCDWNCHSRQFLLGSALLNMGEPDKACDSLIQAAEGLRTDKFLVNQLFSSEPDVDPTQMTVLYFLKIIGLFEQFAYFDYVIELAKTAIDICDDSDSNRSILCFILFSNHLKLGHNVEAYDAMIMNPDRSKRKDSLRQFVVTLFERKQLRELASFPYIDMFEDLEHIIEARARSVDLTRNNYYDFLYSFHVMKENYRKAAHIMYECGMRLGTEMFTLEGLKRQAKCYLACLNSLRLVSEEYAWIVKPVPYSGVSPSDSHLDEHDSAFGVSPKRTAEGEIVARDPELRVKQRMEVLELKDIEKEFELVSARLKLFNKSDKGGPRNMVDTLAGPGLSASECQSLLISANLYNDALHISSLFELDVRPVLEGLASKCIKLASKSKSSERNSAWTWLSENPISDFDIGSIDGTKVSPVDAAWRLLEHYVNRLEKKGQSEMHKAVSKRFFAQGAALPAWMVTSYKRINPAELLRLYLHRGFLEDSTYIALEYVSAVLGEGKTYYGLESALNATARPVWLPYNLLDQLLLELRCHAEVAIYKQLYEELTQKLDYYMKTVRRVSQDMVELRAC